MILDFINSKILLADEFWRAKMHHCAIFSQNPTIHCRVIAIFFIFQDGSHSHLEFLKFSISIGRCSMEGQAASLGQISSKLVK